MTRGRPDGGRARRKRGSAGKRPRGGARRPGRSALLVATVLAGPLLAGSGAAGCRLIRVPDPGTEGEEPPGLRTQVASMLASAAAAWNRGDLEAFMADYERSPNTTYIGSDGLIVGWEGIRDRYAPAFGPGAERDSLRLETRRVRTLGQRHALALGRYVLHRDGRVTGSGPFTLVLLRVEGRWNIVHDHTSSEAPSDTSSAPTDVSDATS